MNGIDPSSSLSSLVAGAMRQLETMLAEQSARQPAATPGGDVVTLSPQAASTVTASLGYQLGDKLSSSLSDGTLVTVGRRQDIIQGETPTYTMTFTGGSGSSFSFDFQGDFSVRRYGDGYAVHDAVNNVTDVYGADGSKNRFSGLLEDADAGRRRSMSI